MVRDDPAWNEPEALMQKLYRQREAACPVAIEVLMSLFTGIFPGLHKSGVIKQVLRVATLEKANDILG